MGKQGKREFVQVLRLMEVFSAAAVAAAVPNAIARGAIGFDGVKHLVLCPIERLPPRLDMTVHPYLPRAQVAMTAAKTYEPADAGAENPFDGYGLAIVPGEKREDLLIERECMEAANKRGA
jgi:hypothetical protein